MTFAHKKIFVQLVLAFSMYYMFYLGSLHFDIPKWHFYYGYAAGSVCGILIAMRVKD